MLIFPVDSRAADPPAEAALAHFERTIAPLLAARCLECHSGLAPEGELDLSDFQLASLGGNSGPAIVAGNPEESAAWQRILHDEMPPRNPLDKQEKELLKAWIAAGAVWSEQPIDPLAYTTDNRAGYDWWSLQPIQEVEPPSEAGQGWARNEIDRFIARRLDQAGLRPSAEADPRTLIRRLHHDLIGLPPTSEEVERFAADPSDAAYAQLVEELLASPHYGERWGRHWLDVARYGESHGFERNDPRHHAWHYRDWVISALNDDMPYDRFARMQIAGDFESGGCEGTASVGFLVAGVHNTVVGSSERMRRLARQDELEEIVGAVGQTFLGLTINCARCHDHKFDPISLHDYYAMIAAIDGVSPINRLIRREQSSEDLEQLDRHIAELTAELARIDEPARAEIAAQRRARQEEGTDAEEAARADLPQPLAAWDFTQGLNDLVGKLHGEAIGTARVTEEGLVLDGSSGYVQTAPIQAAIGEKTLEARVQLTTLDQAGGGVISLETNNGGRFDAIVYGEREPRHWMAGSNSFQRTRPFGGTPEESAHRESVHLAIVYSADGKITAYRNGEPYGSAYEVGLMRFEAGQARLLFGLRHSPGSGNRHLAGTIHSARLYDSALPAEAIAVLAGSGGDFVSEAALLAHLPAEQRQRRAELRQALNAAGTRREAATRREEVQIFTVESKQPRPMQIHVRGSVTDLGEEVAPGGVRALSAVEHDFGWGPAATDQQRRTSLAAWITDPANPLFPRVMVNRVWHYHFGRGLVVEPSDFGFSGGEPSHPELLDWLASGFRRDGYRLKSLHRQIVHSAAYRQASTFNAAALAVDADNRLLWRYSPQRKDAESLRDAMLKIAGELNPARGGPGFVDVSIRINNGTTYYEPFDPEGAEFHRRTVYRFNPRGGRSALLDTFDCPDPSAAAPRRSETTTPLQALSLMNNSFVLRMSERFAARVRDSAGDEIGRQVETAWRLALLRAPTAEEQRLSERLVGEHGLAALCRALFNSNEFVYIE